VIEAIQWGSCLTSVVLGFTRWYERQKQLAGLHKLAFPITISRRLFGNVDWGVRHRIKRRASLGVCANCCTETILVRI
jgi:hypothetical protein